MRHPSDVDSHNSSAKVQGVNATSKGLVKATFGAAIAAGAILTLVWLPAEYGIDPTGAGHVLGLTEMGLIKEQLHAEADADAANNLSAAANQADQADANLNKKLDDIQAQLSMITAKLETSSPTDTVQATAIPAPETQTDTPADTQTDSVPPPPDAWRDEFEYTLAPGEGIEIKLVMNQGAVAEYDWSANGAVLNYDTHGDGSGENISYEKGRSVPEQAGRLTAAFTGNHGWFWRNRTDEDVVLGLRTRGDYQGLVLP